MSVLFSYFFSGIQSESQGITIPVILFNTLWSVFLLAKLYFEVHKRIDFLLRLLILMGIRVLYSKIEITL